MEEIKVVDVDRLKGITGRCIVNGAVHDVHQPPGRVIQRVRAATGAEGATVLFDAVEKCVPTLTHDDVLDLNPDQVGAIWAIACGGIEAVEAMFPNVYRPEAPPTSPA